MYLCVSETCVNALRVTAKASFLFPSSFTTALGLEHSANNLFSLSFSLFLGIAQSERGRNRHYGSPMCQSRAGLKTDGTDARPLGPASTKKGRERA